MKRWLWALCALLVALSGCSRKRSEVYAYDGHYENQAAYAYGYVGGSYDQEMYDYDDYAGDALMAESTAMPAERRKASSKDYRPNAPAPSKQQNAQQQAEPGPRMVHYSGDATLRVARLQEGIDAVEQLAESFGGRVENVYGTAIVIRVPVERFEEAFDAVLALGEVVDRRITAADISESFQATELRLKTAQATLERMQALLAQVTEEEEKLRLLREIQRLREEIDELEGEARTLSALASMSRISVSLVPREALAYQGSEDETAELAWIRQLSPFNTGIYLDAKPLRVSTPEGLVALTKRGPYVAESADGTRLWTHKVANTPVGDADFWRTTIQQRLSRDFGEVTEADHGAWKVLRLEDRSDEPYAWWIAVRVEGRRLHVAQAFFPDLEQEERYRAGLEALLSGGGVS